MKATDTGTELAVLTGAQDAFTQTSQAWLSVLRARDALLWKGVAAYATDCGDRHDVVFEGGVYPDNLATFDVPHVGVFLGAVDDDPQRLLDIMRDDPDSWMAKKSYSEEWVRRWCAHNRERSRMVQTLATENSYPYFDLSHGYEDHDEALAFVLEALS